MNKVYTTYVLHSEKHNKIYIGYTSNLEERSLKLFEQLSFNVLVGCETLQQIDTVMNESTPLALDDKVLLDGGVKCELVELKDIRYFETCGNYCKTYYKDRMILIARTLNYLETKLPERYFFRANRQYIINVTQISSVRLRGHSVCRVELTCGKKIEISRRRSQRFRESLSL